MTEYLKRYFKANYRKVLMYLVAMLVLYAIHYLFRVILNTSPEFAGLPYALVRALAGVLTLKLVDELILYEIETMRILKRNAIAYAIYVLAYALVVALSIAGA